MQNTKIAKGRDFQGKRNIKVYTDFPSSMLFKIFWILQCHSKANWETLSNITNFLYQLFHDLPNNLTLRTIIN